MLRDYRRKGNSCILMPSVYSVTLMACFSCCLNNGPTFLFFIRHHKLCVWGCPGLRMLMAPTPVGSLDLLLLSPGTTGQGAGGHVGHWQAMCSHLISFPKSASSLLLSFSPHEISSRHSLVTE